MDRRQQLHDILLTFVDDVYFQPSENLTLTFPCIVYERYAGSTAFANNQPYRRTKRYTVTVIDREPDSPIIDKVAGLPMCTSNRFFVADNLNHDVFNLYY